MDNMNKENTLTKIISYLRQSIMTKLIVIGILSSLLLIPANLISDLIDEREDRKKEVLDEVSGKWGKDQIIMAPVLSVPYKTDGSDYLSYIYFLPEDIKIEGDLETQTLYRGIYEVPLYNAKLSISGSFKYPDVKQFHLNEKNIMWESSFLTIGISDLRGIKNKVLIKVGDQVLPVNSGVVNKDVVSSGMNASLDLSGHTGKISFNFSLDVNGSNSVKIVPIGETTTINLSSNWSSPSFGGAFLPVNREVNDKGFKAAWNILHLNRDYPQMWQGKKEGFNSSAVGVDLFLSNDHYQKSTRTIKYAILFVMLTFTTFFFSEIMNKCKVHPIQYLLVGVAIILFYILLVSVSEHIEFNLAYLVSSSAIILMITGYTKAILRSFRFALSILGILSALYSCLYVILQMEDYSLLLGSVVLFLALGLIMYVTRRVDWYSLKVQSVEK